MVGVINGRCDKNINECIQEFERISKQVLKHIFNILYVYNLYLNEKH